MCGPWSTSALVLSCQRGGEFGAMTSQASIAGFWRWGERCQGPWQIGDALSACEALRLPWIEAVCFCFVWMEVVECVSQQQSTQGLEIAFGLGGTFFQPRHPTLHSDTSSMNAFVANCAL